MRKMYKRVLALFLAVAVVIIGLPANALFAQAEEIAVIGDVKDDGVLDIRDLTRFKRILSGDETMSGSMGTVDLNADELVDASDIRIERRLLLGTGYHYSDTSWAEAADTVMWSHGFAEGWKAVSVSLTDNTEQNLVKSGKYYYINGDETKSAYLNNGHIMPAKDHDLAYVYTMPCKATINLVINGSIQADDTDGSVVYAYINDSSRCIVNRKVITNTNNKPVASADSITLNKGDKLYVRMNKKDTVPAEAAETIEELGWFYAKLTYTKIYPEEVSEGETYDKTTWQEMANSDPNVSYSHGSLTNSTAYPYWKTVSIDENGVETPMEYNSTDKKAYVSGDSGAYFETSGKAMTSENNDLAYVYTMPCKAKIDLQLSASVNSTNSDGVVVYAYVNDMSRGLIRTVVTTVSSGKDAYSVRGITLDKGDKIYFRLNKNVTTTDDYGFFYGAIDFIDEEPDTGIYQGTAFDENVTWAEMASGKGIGSGTSTTVNLSTGTSYSHGSLTDSVTYANWEYKSVKLSDASEEDMVILNSNNELRYVNGDTSAYVRQKNQAAVPGAKHDVMYVYTMPVTAKVKITLNASANLNSTVSDPDGVYVYCYVNDKSNGLISESVTSTATQSFTVDNVILQKGDKIYFRLNNNGTFTKNAYGVFYGAVTYKDEAPVGEPYQGNDFGNVTWAEAAKGVGTVDGVTTAHLSIDTGDGASLTYPGWDYKAVNLSSGEIVGTIINSNYPDIRYSPSSSVYIRKNNNGAFQVTDAYDMMYVYTMPCKARVNVAITAKTTSGSAVVSAYVNEESNGLLRWTAKTGDTTNTYALNAITLDKGAKIYFRVNGAGETAKGTFTGTVTFLSETPDAEVYQGEEFGEVTWTELANGSSAGTGSVINITAKGTTYSHGSINTPTTYRYWQTKSVSLLDGNEADLITGSAEKTMYVNDGTESAYVNGSAYAQSGEDHDLVYLFTMPAAAKVKIALQASVNSIDSDGVIVSCYVNEPSNYVIDSACITSTSKTALYSPGYADGEGIILNKGDKIYFRLNKNETTTDDYGFFYGTIIFMPEAPVGTAYNQAEEHTLLATDVTNGGVVVMNADALNASAALLRAENTIWSWYPDTEKGWSVTEIALKDAIDDAKVRWSSYWQRQVVIMTASRNWAGIADYATGKCLYEWSAEINNAVTTQPHSIEMLPNGDVVIASTGVDTDDTSVTSGQLHYMHMENGIYTETSTVSLHSAHGVLWDPEYEVIWALGYNQLVAYQTNSAYELVKDEEKGITLEQKGGHALSADYENPDQLWISANENVLKFSKSQNRLLTAYTYSDSLLSMQKVKGVASFGDGMAAYVVGDGSGVLSDASFTYAGDGFSIIGTNGITKYTFNDMATYKVYNFTTSYGGESNAILELEK